MVERILATLRLEGLSVADYNDGSDLDPAISPRPYLHPVRTLGGSLVTDAEPADHRWHLGISVAVPDVDGWNFWGGPTYVHGQGYVWRDDHGRITHTDITQRSDQEFTEWLYWLTRAGELLLAEQRRIGARRVEQGWQLEIITVLTNITNRPIRLGSPATNGRKGAGYGGLFWRLPPVRQPHVRTAAAEGEQAVHDRAAQWLAWTDPASSFTVVFMGTDEATRADPWFVRVEDYPGVGSQIAARNPLTLPTGGTATRGLRALLVDGVLDDDAAQAWADFTASDPRPRG